MRPQTKPQTRRDPNQFRAKAACEVRDVGTLREVVVLADHARRPKVFLGAEKRQPEPEAPGKKKHKSQVHACLRVYLNPLTP